MDDKAYPPQKKCFMMMRYMYDNHINDYEWFMRVDDDAYLDYSRLTQLLNTINSSLPIFFGSPGFGIDPDDGMEQGILLAVIIFLQCCYYLSLNYDLKN